MCIRDRPITADNGLPVDGSVSQTGPDIQTLDCSESAQKALHLHNPSSIPIFKHTPIFKQPPSIRNPNRLMKTPQPAAYNQTSSDPDRPLSIATSLKYETSTIKTLR